MADGFFLRIWAINATRAGFRAAISGLRRFSAGVRRIMGRVTASLKRFAMLASAALIASVKHAASFRSAMAEVDTMIVKGTGDIRELSKQVVDLSMQLGIAKDRLAKGLYQALSAGVPPQNAIEFLAEASRAAVGGCTDVMTAVDGLTTIINAYGMRADQVTKVSDLMFTTVRKGKTTFEELSSRIGMVAGIAAKANITLEDLLASIATITKQGIQTDMAVTGLRQAILAVIAPGEALTKQFRKLGTTGEELVKERGLAGAFEVVAEMAAGSTAQMKKLIPNIRAIPAILAMTGKNAKMAQQDIAAMANSTGAAGEAFEKLHRVRHWQRIWHTILGAAQKFGAVLNERVRPQINAITDRLKEFLAGGKLEEWAGKLSDHLERAKELVEAIFAGGEERRLAIEELKGMGKSLANKAVEILKKYAADIGGTIGKAAAKAIATAPYEFGKWIGKGLAKWKLERPLEMPTPGGFQAEGMPPGGSRRGFGGGGTTQAPSEVTRIQATRAGGGGATGTFPERGITSRLDKISRQLDGEKKATEDLGKL